MHDILDNRKIEKLRVYELFSFDTRKVIKIPNNETKLNSLWQ